MSQNEDLIQVAIERGSLLIRCLDRKDADSKRVSLFHTRRKMPELVRNCVGISNYRKDGIYYVKIWLRKELEIFEENEQGEIVSVKIPDRTVDRLIDKMREDGMTDEQIAEYFQTEKGEESESKKCD